MRIRVDRDKCRGHNRCYALAPQLFDVDDLGYSTAKNEGRVPRADEKTARLVLDNCPEYAIEVVED
jgi:ferredoxin